MVLTQSLVRSIALGPTLAALVLGVTPHAHATRSRGQGRRTAGSTPAPRPTPPQARERGAASDPVETKLDGGGPSLEPAELPQGVRDRFQVVIRPLLKDALERFRKAETSGPSWELEAAWEAILFDPGEDRLERWRNLGLEGLADEYRSEAIRTAARLQGHPHDAGQPFFPEVLAALQEAVAAAVARAAQCEGAPRAAALRDAALASLGAVQLTCRRGAGLDLPGLHQRLGRDGLVTQLIRGGALGAEPGDRLRSYLDGVVALLAPHPPTGPAGISTRPDRALLNVDMQLLHRALKAGEPVAADAGAGPCPQAARARLEAAALVNLLRRHWGEQAERMHDDLGRVAFRAFFLEGRFHAPAPAAAADPRPAAAGSAPCQGLEHKAAGAEPGLAAAGGAPGHGLEHKADAPAMASGGAGAPARVPRDPDEHIGAPHPRPQDYYRGQVPPDEAIRPGAVLIGAKLRGMKLPFRALNAIDLQESDSDQADFFGCDLGMADFRKADVTGTRFDQAKVCQARFAGTRGLDLDGARRHDVFDWQPDEAPGTMKLYHLPDPAIRINGLLVGSQGDLIFQLDGDGLWILTPTGLLERMPMAQQGPVLALAKAGTDQVVTVQAGMAQIQADNFRHLQGQGASQTVLEIQAANARAALVGGKGDLWVSLPGDVTAYPIPGAPAGQLPPLQPRDRDGSPLTFTSLAATPNGRRIFGVDPAKDTIFSWGPPTGRKLREFPLKAGTRPDRIVRVGNNLYCFNAPGHRALGFFRHVRGEDIATPYFCDLWPDQPRMEVTSLAAGPDGKVWFGTRNPAGIGWTTESGGGTLEVFPDPGPGEPEEVAAGPSGEVYFTLKDRAVIGCLRGWDPDAKSRDGSRIPGGDSEQAEDALAPEWLTPEQRRQARAESRTRQKQQPFAWRVFSDGPPDILIGPAQGGAIDVNCLNLTIADKSLPKSEKNGKICISVEDLRPLCRDWPVDTPIPIEIWNKDTKTGSIKVDTVVWTVKPLPMKISLRNAPLPSQDPDSKSQQVTRAPGGDTGEAQVAPAPPAPGSGASARERLAALGIRAEDRTLRQILDGTAWSDTRAKFDPERCPDEAALLDLLLEGLGLASGQAQATQHFDGANRRHAPVLLARPVGLYQDGDAWRSTHCLDIVTETVRLPDGTRVRQLVSAFPVPPEWIGMEAGDASAPASASPASAPATDNGK